MDENLMHKTTAPALQSARVSTRLQLQSTYVCRMETWLRTNFTSRKANVSLTVSGITKLAVAVHYPAGGR